MTGTHTRSSALAATALGLALIGAAAASPIAAFLDAWDDVSGYTCDIAVHETRGAQVQDRTYHYAFLKPHFARIDITGGPGRGSGAVWSGGDTVSGHQGGLLSMIHLRISIHDPRAVDLRGSTIDAGSFANMAEALRSAPSATTGESTVDGAPADVVTFPYADGEGATRRAIYLSRATHLPMRRVTYAGAAVVEDERFTNVDPHAALSDRDFKG